jgi:NADH:ubiquinone oxidoreductase subunit 5 (subunit L)/multisubunit Na+/H+ antiporter MnhA subunit
MTWPLIILAIPTVMIGWPVFIIPIVGGTPILENMLNYTAPLAITEHHETAHQLAVGISILIAAVGIGLSAAFYYYGIFSAAEFARRAAPVYEFLRHKWYFDEIYHAVFVRPTLALAQAAAGFDRVIIDGVVDGSAYATAGLSRLGGWFDRVFVDGLVNLVAQITYVIGDWGRSIQTGHLRAYLMVLAVGVVALSIGLFRWIQLG